MAFIEQGAEVHEGCQLIGGVGRIRNHLRFLGNHPCSGVEAMIPKLPASNWEDTVRATASSKGEKFIFHKDSPWSHE